MAPLPDTRPGRRAADRAPSRLQGLAVRLETIGGARERLLALVSCVGVGSALVLLRLWEVGPAVLGNWGSVLLCAAFAWALARRVDGRPMVALALAVVAGVVTVLSGGEFGELMHAGAAVFATVLSGMLAVLATIPSRSFLGAVREGLLAVGIAGVGALAMVGFDPVVSRQRFVYLTLAMAIGLMLVVVYRLGAGLTGLGRRGLIVVLIGSVLILLSLGYVDLIQRYGSNGVVEAVSDTVGWSRDHLGAFPRLIVVLVGVPALVWGIHMRARRRQGWWVCAFGVAATVPVAQMFINPDKHYGEAVLQVVYSVLLGLVVAWVVIRVDLILTGSRGSRARRLEEATAVRPEPSRFAAL